MVKKRSPEPPCSLINRAYTPSIRAPFRCWGIGVIAIRQRVDSPFGFSTMELLWARFIHF
ncbi:MAG: hypothetical protein ACFFCF_07205 [Promethearchaeota archaeon]